MQVCVGILFICCIIISNDFQHLKQSSRFPTPLRISTLLIPHHTIVLLPQSPCAVQPKEHLVVWATGGHQPVALALLPVPLLPPSQRACWSHVMLVYILALSLTAVVTQGATVHGCIYTANWILDNMVMIIMLHTHTVRRCWNLCV